MQNSSLIFVLLTAIVVVAIVAKRLAIPYPIAFVIGGSLLAFAPHVPSFQLDPSLVFLIFLPPLLYAGGWLTDWADFKANLRPIGLLAVGLVVFTTGIVGIVFHALAPQLGWGVAFVLGAIVSPPDAVAASSVFERFSVPRRIAAILDGEGLVNDASALVIYRFAVAAVLTGAFSIGSASLAFVGVSVGGVMFGILAGWGLVWLMKFLRRFELSDSLIGTAIQLVIPYAIYVGGEAVHASGVLATVAAGVYVSRNSSAIFEPEERLLAFSVWELLVFLLNGAVFLLIGLQVRAIVHGLSFAPRELYIGIIISLVVIGVRILWTYSATYLPRLVFPSINRREGVPGWNYVFVLAWSGMRGIVSLASALALPATTISGEPFPGRSMILLVTFCVIVITLVGQGLSLIPLLKWLRIEGDNLNARELEIRAAALRAGIAHMRELEPEFGSTEEWEVEGRIIAEYEYRIGHLLGHLDGSISPSDVAVDHKLQYAALAAERREIARLRDAGEIPDEVFRKVQYDLDLASERLT